MQVVLYIKFSPLKYFSSTFLINCIFLPLLLSIKQSDNLHNSAILEGVQNVGDKLKQGPAFLVIGDAYYNLADFRQALHNHKLYLSYIEEEDRAAIGRAHGILGKDHLGLGNHKHALIGYEQQLEIAKGNWRESLGTASLRKSRSSLFQDRKF